MKRYEVIGYDVIDQDGFSYGFFEKKDEAIRAYNTCVEVLGDDDTFEINVIIAE